jgi:ribonuclease T1
MDRAPHRPPARLYRSKRAAEAAGWRRGEPVWDVLPGHAIGGDRFGNRERLLPEPQPGGYREADLDDSGGRRGASRLVFAERTRGRWDLWITTDHYRSFVAVEAP